MSDFNLLYLVPLGSILALAFVAFLAFRILRLDEGTDKMKEIALAVKVGARAYLRRQYFGVSIFFAVVFFILLGLSF